MTSNEFPKWLAAHCAAFPGVHPWFLNMPSPRRHGIQKDWFRKLAAVPLADAIKASQEFSDSGEGGPYGQHCLEVRRRAMRYKRQQVMPAVEDDIQCPTPAERLAACRKRFAK